MSACILHEALGRREECPGGDCALWLDGCAIRHLKIDLLERQELALYMLDLRKRLEQLRAA